MKKDSYAYSVFTGPRSFSLTISIIFLLVFGAASVIAHQHYKSMLRHTINENKSTANILSTLIYEHQKAAIGILESYSTRPAFVAAIQKKDFDQAIPRLKSLSEHYTEIDALFLTDQYGNIWANYPISRESYGKNLAYRDWYKGISRNWRPYISTVFRLIVREKLLAVAIAVPVLDRKGNVIGIFGITQSTAFLTNLIKANKLDPKKNITLLDQEGNIIYSDTFAYEKEITKYPHFSFIQKAINDGKNTLEAIDHSYDMLAFSPIKNIGWTVIVGEEKGAILKSATREYIEIFSIAFLLFVCMSIVLLLFQRELRHRKTKELLTNERRLRESEVKYKELFDNVIEGIFQTTPDGHFLTVNPSLARIYGYDSPEEIINKVTDIGRQVYVNPDERDEFLRIIQEKGIVTNFELQLRKKDESTFWGSINARSVYDKDGKLLYYEGTSEDITPRKQAEIALRESRDKLAVIAEGSAIPQFAIDKDHTVILWNKALEIYSGVKAIDVLGTQDHWKAFYPEKRPCLVDLIIERVTEDEIAQWYGNTYSESNLIDEAYEAIGYFPLMKEGSWVHFTAAAIKDSSGNTVAGIETLEDITGLRATEVLLRQSEEKYHSIFENAVEGIFQSTPDGRFLTVNPAMAHMHGFASPEKMVSNITDIGKQLYVNPEDRERYRAILEEKGEINSFEAQVYRKDGSTIWTSTNARAVKDAAGNISWFEGTAEDITDRKKAEEALKNSENKFYRAFHANPALMAISTFEDGRYIDVNESFLQTLGYSMEEVIGHTSKDMNVFVNYADRQRIMTVFEEEGEIRSVEVKVRSKTGDVHTGLFSASVIDIEGEQCWISVFEDMTDLKIAEDMVRKSEQRYRSIFENAVEGIFQSTPDGRYLNVNPSFFKMFGFGSSQEMVETVTDIGRQLYVNPDDRERLKDLLTERNSVEGFEVELYRKDRTKFWVSINVHAVRDSNGAILYWEGTNEDITHRKLSEEKLRKSLAGTIQALSSTVETRDPYTAGHQRKVSNLARAIAQEMGLSSDTVDTIRMAGIIHDIGKISVPAEILSKPGKISDIEMSLIKIHSQSGYDILKDVELPYPIAEIVFQHHERLDGSGYPRALKNGQILLEAKIISVADVVEAISSFRPYRPGFGIDVALEEIGKNKGILYDEKVVEVCVKLFREKGFEFE